MRKRNLFLIFLISCFILIPLFLSIWTARAEGEAHDIPEYDQIDLESLLQKTCLEDADYELLFQQTGLSKPGVDQLYGSSRQEQLLYLQQRLFAPVAYECRCSYMLCRSERIIGQDAIAKSKTEINRQERDESEENRRHPGYLEDNYAFCPTAQDGDILVTFSGHLFGWRSGHAGLVIDAEEGKTLEAITIGQNSQIRSLNSWQEYPGFALLRLKGADEEERGEIAAYAAQNLADIPYNLLSFCEKRTDMENHSRSKAEREPEAEEDASKDMSVEYAGTHCAHLVWLAYRHFGYDLDSDGGYVVTPRDLYESDLLELVQIYGISPE